MTSSMTPLDWTVIGAYFFGLLLVVLSLALAIYLFSRLTVGIDEVEELRKGNLSIAILLAGVILAVGLMLSQALGQIVVRLSSTLF